MPDGNWSEKPMVENSALGSAGLRAQATRTIRSDAAAFFIMAPG